MLPKHRIPTHPGQILLEEFLVPMEIPQTQLAAHLKVPVQRINELINGKRGVTPDTAWLLAAALKTSPLFWMNLQTQHDLARNRPTTMLSAIPSMRSTRSTSGTSRAVRDAIRSVASTRSQKSSRRVS